MNKREVAAKWFDGDEEKATNVYYSLPYSTIPDWWHVDAVMQAIAGEASDDA